MLTADDLFELISTGGKDANPFEPVEITEAYIAFLNKLKAHINDEEQFEELHRELMDLLYREEKNAFKVGFNTVKEIIS